MPRRARHSPAAAGLPPGIRGELATDSSGVALGRHFPHPPNCTPEAGTGLRELSQRYTRVTLMKRVGVWPIRGGNGALATEYSLSHS
jgi:hypothetical protein